MAIAYKSAGAGVSTETSGAALSPACPATVDANDILLLFTAWEGTTNAPTDPAGWTKLASSPYNVGSAAVVARVWLYGKIAAGTEDGATVALGSPAVTDQRAARIYSFSGFSAGTITDLIPSASFSSAVGDADPTGPTVVTTVAGSLACAFVYQNDNNTLETFAGSSDTWTERGTVGGYIFALAPGGVLDLLTATPAADPGTVSGGAMTVTNDPWVVIGFEIRPSVPPPVAKSGTDTVTLGDSTAIARASTVTDALTLGESAAVTAAEPKAGTDALTLAESTALAQTQPNTGTDTLTLGDTVGISAAPTQTDSLTLTDTGQLVPAVAGADALAITELLSTLTGAGVASDSLTLGESASVATTGAAVVATPTPAAPDYVMGFALHSRAKPKPKKKPDDDDALFLADVL